MFTWQILNLPTNSLYKQILVYRLVQIKALQYSTDQTTPVADIVRILKEFNMIEHINRFIANGMVMSKCEWKNIVKDKENKEWTATSLFYRGLNDFKSTSIKLKTGCPRWDFAKWDCSLLWKIKVMWMGMTNFI